MLKALYRPILTALFVTALAVNSAQALPVDYYTSTSLLASGKWVKVKVSQTGMQQLTFDQLREMGFSNPENVAVYGYSGVDLRNYNFSTNTPDDLPAVPVAVYGDKLVFYGVASDAPVEYLSTGSTTSVQKFAPQIQRNLQNLYSYYFLTEDQPQLAVTVSDEAASDAYESVSKAQGLVWKNFVDRHPGIGAYLLSENISSLSGCKQSYNVEMPAFNGADTDNTALTFAVACKAATAKVGFSLGDVNYGTVSMDNYGSDPGHLYYKYKSAVLQLTGISSAESNQYPLAVDFSGSTTITEGAVDYYVVSYPRSTDVSAWPQQLLAFSKLSSGQAVTLTYDGDKQNLKVWEVTTCDTPRELAVKSIDGDAYGFVADRTVNMTQSVKGLQTIVFDPTKELMQPEVVGEVGNQNYHGMSVPDMLIVASPNCYQQALRLAEAHKEINGYDVAVVPFHDVCNEFSSGLPHVMGPRRLAKMLYDRDPSKFKAVLIFGRAYYDNTATSTIETAESLRDSYIPMLECENTANCGESPKSYASDMLYGMLEDNFTFDYLMSDGHFLKAPLSVKVGRIPAVSDGEASGYVDKVIKYMKDPTTEPLYNRAIIMTDKGDANLHMGQGINLQSLLNTLSPSTVPDMLLLSLYASNGSYNEQIREKISQQLKRGLGLWIFLGHSTGGSYIGTLTKNIWAISYDKNVTTDIPTFTIFGTCQSLTMDNMSQTLQDEMLLNASGGNIAGIGPSRPVYAQYNYYLVNMMTQGFYTRKPGDTMGDVFKEGRNLYVNNPDKIVEGIGSLETVAINNLAYNFVGDPMVPMRQPGGKVAVAKVDGKEVDDSQLEFEPLSTHNFEGYIYTEDGAVDTSFNGELTMSIYDGNHTVSSTDKNDSANPVLDVNIDGTLLQEVKFAVVNGQFSGPVTFANPSYIGTYNRVTMFAITTDMDRSSVGVLNNVLIDRSSSSSVDESTAPVITAMYAGDEDFIENDQVPGSFTLYATVEAGELSLLGRSDRIGGSVSLTLDDSKNLVGVDGYLTLNADGSASLEYPVTELSDGLHTLTLRITNVGGVSAERSLNVTVVNTADAEVVVKGIARTEAVINVENHTTSDEPAGRLVIYDPAGKVVFTKDVDEFPYTWNLKDAEDKAVADGVYTAKVYFKAGRHYGCATPASIVVAR
jgi:hypothetical protein